MYQIASFNELKIRSSFWRAGKFDISAFLPNHELYFAHKPKEGSPSAIKETLEEHLASAVGYFFRLIETHALEECINDLIKNVIPSHFSDKRCLSNFIKEIFLDVIVYHDFGKVNHVFQKERMGNENSRIPTITHNFKHYHSALGAYLFAIHHYIDNTFEGEEQGFIDYIVSLFTYPILKHHSSKLLSPFDNINMATEADYFKKYLSFFNKDISNIDLLEKLNNDFIKDSTNTLEYLFNDGHDRDGMKTLLTDSFTLYALIKLNYSLLTAADYLATSQYMNGTEIQTDADFGILTGGRVEEIYQFMMNSEWLNEFEQKKNYNKGTYQVLKDYQAGNPQIKNNDNLNVLRQEMAIEVIEGIRVNKKSNLFYIEAPTGGGKTNLSMLAVVELLNSNPELNKVYYVFPFTTLITQTYKSIIETMGLRPDEVVQLYSKAGFQTKESEKDGQYGNEKRNYIDNLFVNFPFCLLTHIKFFDILKTNEKETNYLLHRLANSVIIIDELQSYNPAHWDKVIYFIKNYARFYNIKFILMSATLPKLDELEVIKDQVNDFVYLLKNARKDYFNNPNFKHRVGFNFDLLNRNDLTLEELASILLEKSREYAEKDFGVAKPPESIHVIIEFIFKKSATQFYEVITQINDDFFQEIFVLSGTILEHRRRYIIEHLKNPDNRKKRILLITTQVVEAGVDIDMDMGFKDRSLIDSDEQLAGRINRNVNKDDCMLYIFNYNNERIIYGKDKRYDEMKKLSNDEYERILIDKDFDTLYKKVLKNIDAWNSKPMAIGFKDYEDKIRSLKFNSVHDDFRLIEQNNISCFVPLAIPCQINDKPFFSESELYFLSMHKVYPNLVDRVEGEEVFNIYLSLIQSRNSDFVKQKVSDKILQGIMSKYIFSVFASEKIKTQIVHFSDEEKSKFGYKYLNRWVEFYDELTGMRDNDFNSNETQFL